MSGDGKDGAYCSICGGIPPDKITTKRILVEGKETGIDQLDWIIADVRKQNLPTDTAITEALLSRVKKFNYVPTKKTEAYAAALLAEYKTTVTK